MLINIITLCSKKDCIEVLVKLSDLRINFPWKIWTRHVDKYMTLWHQDMNICHTNSQSSFDISSRSVVVSFDFPERPALTWRVSHLSILADDCWILNWHDGELLRKIKRSSRISFTESWVTYLLYNKVYKHILHLNREMIVLRCYWYFTDEKKNPQPYTREEWWLLRLLLITLIKITRYVCDS